MNSYNMKFYVNGQDLERGDSKLIVGGSRKYLTAKFTFSKDWADRVEEVIDEKTEKLVERITHVTKTAIFLQTTTGFSIRRILNSDNEITSEMKLELLPGLYEVTVQGSTPEALPGYVDRVEDGVFITTDPVRLRVEPSSYGVSNNCTGGGIPTMSSGNCCDPRGMSSDSKFVEQLVDIAETAVSVKQAAERGDFTPALGKDYWTDADQRNILTQAVEIIRDDGLEQLIHPATTKKAGIVQIGEGLAVTDKGVISATSTIDDEDYTTKKTWSSAKISSEIESVSSRVYDNNSEISNIKSVVGITDEDHDPSASSLISKTAKLREDLTSETSAREESDQALSDRIKVVEDDLNGTEIPKVTGIKTRLSTTEDCLNREIMNRRSAITALDNRVYSLENKLDKSIYEVADDVFNAKTAAEQAAESAKASMEATSTIYEEAIGEITKLADDSATELEELSTSIKTEFNTEKESVLTEISTAKTNAVKEVNDSIAELDTKEADALQAIQTREEEAVDAVAAEEETQKDRLIEKTDEQLQRIPDVTEMRTELDEFKENLVLVTDIQPTSEDNRLWLKQTPPAPINLATPEDLGLLLEMNKVADYLYELNYNVTDYAYAKNYFLTKKPDVTVGGCSAARFGNFYGRNLDWTYDNNVEFVIKTPANNGLHGTIGVSGPVTSLTRELVESRAYDEAYKILPFMLVDGINDAGVICNTNVVPLEKGKTTGTTPTSTKTDEICSLMLPRYILDNFSTAADAVDHIQKHVSVFVPDTLHNMGYETHLMVADKNDTYIIEFVDNSTKIIPVNDYPFMTNFHLYDIVRNSNGSVYTPETKTSSADAMITNHITAHGSGLERYNLINSNKATANTKSGMRALMDKLLYSNTYKRTTSPFWYTEFVGSNTVSSSVSSFESVIGTYIAYFNDRARGDGRTWHTTHSAVYDIAAKTLYLRSQEADEEFTYKFNYCTMDDVQESTSILKSELEAMLDNIFK